MGSGCSSYDRVGGGQMTDEARRGLEVEAEMVQARLRDLFKFKILLLGAGESGKSTVVKQLRLVHKRKPTENDLKNCASSLHSNVLECMHALVRAAEKFGYEFSADEVDAVALAKDLYGKMASGQPVRLSFDQASKLKALFEGETLQRTYDRRDEFWLLDACPYYMANVTRFAGHSFTPTEEDMVMARVRTTGIIVSNLEEKRHDAPPDEPQSYVYQVVDVGGQRNERKKWIHCFSDVKALFFVVSLAGYNQVLFEDPTKNRMQESLELFKDTVGAQHFQNAEVFLFLNKKDLFEVMLRDKDLSELFPDYHGGPDVLAAIEYVSEKFRSVVPHGRNVQIQAVTGVVKRDIRYAFMDVKAQLLKQVHDEVQRELKSLKAFRHKIDKLRSKHDKNASKKKAQAS